MKNDKKKKEKEILNRKSSTGLPKSSPKKNKDLSFRARSICAVAIAPTQLGCDNMMVYFSMFLVVYKYCTVSELKNIREITKDLFLPGLLHLYSKI
jgi:hypothetical protein